MTTQYVVTNFQYLGSEPGDSSITVTGIRESREEGRELMRQAASASKTRLNAELQDQVDQARLEFQQARDVEEELLNCGIELVDRSQEISIEENITFKVFHYDPANGRCMGMDTDTFYTVNDEDFDKTVVSKGDQGSCQYNDDGVADTKEVFELHTVVP